MLYRMARFSQTFSLLVLVMVVVASAHVATSRNLDEIKLVAKHERWMARHGRVYESKEEEKTRFEIFKENVKLVREFNRVGNQTYKLGINQFSDLTDEEFRTFHASGYKRSEPFDPKASATPFMYKNVSLAQVPPSLDWRQMGAVTPVKNQQHCSSCSVFSAVGALEGINKIKTGQLISLSEKEVLDCIGETNVCHGGTLMTHVFTYAARNGGLLPETYYYPYTEAQDACRLYPREVTSGYRSPNIRTYENIPYGSEAALLQAVVNQPVSVAVDMSTLKQYGGGIVSGNCPRWINHALTLVGYGEEYGYKYWLAKNSWGDTWGEGGYIRFQRDAGVFGGTCGIAMEASYPVAY